LLVTALALNQTRAAFLSIIAGYAALCYADRRFLRWFKPAIAACLLGVALMELLPTGRSIVGSIQAKGLSLGGAAGNPQLDRLALWNIAWRMFLDHPWVGVGPANFETMFTGYFQGIIGYQKVWSSAHNIVLHQLAERGLIGFAALTGLAGVFWLRARQRAVKIPNAWNLWALAATAAFFVLNLTDTALQNEQLATFYFFIWATAEARHARHPQD
jgi:O-antigen ligase